MSDDIVDQVIDALKAKHMMLSVAESCTGGFLATLITRKAGASAIFERGFVTYSNAAKHECLGVPMDLIETHGAVSAQVAQAMAEGALKNSHADLSVSITGIAGPDGGSDEKPVGLVYFGYALKGGSTGAVKHNFTGTRHDIQNQAAVQAINELITVLQ